MMKLQIQQADPHRLADLIDLDPQPERPSGPADLAGLLRFQLAAPLEADLERLGPGLCHRMAAKAAAGSRRPPGKGSDRAAGPVDAGGVQPFNTFADLLAHPEPPLELLDLVKQFAKRSRQDAGGHLPTEIAAVLYSVSIGVALLRRGTRISGLSADELRSGIEWARAQTWARPALGDLLDQIADWLERCPSLDQRPRR